MPPPNEIAYSRERYFNFILYYLVCIVFYYNYLSFSIFIDAPRFHITPRLSRSSDDSIAYYVKTTLTLQETTGPSNKIVWSSNFAKFFAELHRQISNIQRTFKNVNYII